MTGSRVRPFKLLGYKLARAVFDERALVESADETALDLVIVPGKEIVVSNHTAEERKVLELSMIIAAVRKGAIQRSDIGDGEACFGKDGVIAVQMHAGYISRDKDDEENIQAFQGMMLPAIEQLYQATRAQIVSLSVNTSFDASDIPAEFDTVASLESETQPARAG